MGKKIVIGLSLSLLVSSLSADALKNSLTNIMNTKEESASMVDLGNINLNTKPKVKKSRSAQAVVATVNGENVLKKDADTYLAQRTQGKVTDFDSLPKDQRIRLINELSLPILALNAAKKELSDKEKEAVFARVWMQKEARKIKISDDDALSVYNQLKKQAEDANATEPVPPFEKIKQSLKGQMVEKRMMDNLTKGVKIKLY